MNDKITLPPYSVYDYLLPFLRSITFVFFLLLISTVVFYISWPSEFGAIPISLIIPIPIVLTVIALLFVPFHFLFHSNKRKKAIRAFKGDGVRSEFEVKIKKASFVQKFFSFWVTWSLYIIDNGENKKVFPYPSKKKMMSGRVIVIQDYILFIEKDAGEVSHGIEN